MPKAPTAGRQLNTYVTVHPEGEASVTYGPGDKVPDKHRELITNPNVWAKPGTKPDTAAGTKAGAAAGTSGSGTPPEPPPVNYREVQDLDVLRAMATDKGVDNANTLDHDALIEALEATSPPSTDTTVR